jgi:hypothetical protein
MRTKMSWSLIDHTVGSSRGTRAELTSIFYCTDLQFINLLLLLLLLSLLYFIYAMNFGIYVHIM